MVAAPRIWAPDEWENWINRLLKLKYGFQYQPVPAGNRGDFGMEGFSTQDGCVFQCYAPEEPLTTERRYEKHRDKITRDTEKLVGNRRQLERLFASIPVRQWILVVPLYDDKQLLVHAANRTAHIRQQQLPYVAPDFHVLVADESFFELELASLSQLGSVPEPTPAQLLELSDVQQWFDSNPEPLATLDRKLRAIPRLNATDLAKFRLNLLERYARGLNILRGYHENYPDLGDEIVKLKHERANSLALECLLDPQPSNSMILDVYGKHTSDLQNRIYGLPKTTAEALSWEAVVEWMFNCPLEFVGGDHT
jgi:hypothetical protein